jgi:hypothetical protein
MPQIEAGPWMVYPLLLVGLSMSENDEELARGVTLVAAASRYIRDEGIEGRWFVPVLERNEIAACAALGDSGYEARVQIGGALSRSEAIELALSPIDSPTPAEQAPLR